MSIRLIVIGITTLPLAACGGGGGGEDSDNEETNISESSAPGSSSTEKKEAPQNETGSWWKGNNPPEEEPPAVEKPPVVAVPPPPNNEGPYFDDTFEILASGLDVVAVSGPFGYDDYSYGGRDNVALDARGASFILANSKNSNPTNSYKCGKGSLPTNEYPLKVNGSDNTWVVGGIWNGEIPLTSDRGPTYCNSSAIIYKDAPGGGVDGIRVTSSWDTIRPANSSDYMTVKNNWITDVRDDAIENDHYLNMIIEDNLMDRVYMAISMRDKDANSQSPSIVQILGNVILLSEWYDDSRWKIGAFVKTNSKTPYLVVKNTVVAVDSPRVAWTADGNWEDTWNKVITSGADACSNNKFLWLSDEPIPRDYELANMPACFTLETGAKARASWAAAKQNWIDCHPKVARTPDDEDSNPARCVANNFGGYSQSGASF